MKINIITLKSMIHDSKEFNEASAQFLKEINDELKLYDDFEFTINEKNELLNLIFVETGGSEGLFLNRINEFKEPYYLLTSGNNNSLAASLEIMTYLNIHNKKGEIIHGGISYIAKRIHVLYKLTKIKEDLKNIKLGVIGKPSDWLISSIPSYDLIKEKLGISIIDIPMDELLNEYNKPSFERRKDIKIEYDKDELYKADKIYNGLSNIVSKYNLSGLTLRCFDLLSSVKSTGCLGLAYLNHDHITATCEGDISAMLSMAIVEKVFNQYSFQANPSRIDVERNRIVFAHCTVPFGMRKDYHLTTHFESKIGLAIKGELQSRDITILRLSSNLKDYFISEGKILKNLNDPNLCRTQIEVELEEDVTTLLKKPCGNHHIIFYGRHKALLEDILSDLLK